MVRLELPPGEVHINYTPLRKGRHRTPCAQGFSRQNSWSNLDLRGPPSGLKAGTKT